MANSAEHPIYYPIGGDGMVGALDLVRKDPDETLSYDHTTDYDRGRILVRGRNGRLVSVIFTGAGPAVESVRRKTAHYRDANRPILPDVDIRGLSVHPGMPSEAEITLLMNGSDPRVVPEVTEDLIPH